MLVNLYDIINAKWAIDLSSLHKTWQTHFISVCWLDGSWKTSLRNNLAKYFSEKWFTVIVGKSPCDRHLVNLLNNAISQNGYKDWYTEELLFRFCDGLLSNYLKQLNNYCDYFICQRWPSDAYTFGIIRSEKRNYQEIHDLQRPERLIKFDDYIHLNCNAKVAWDRIKNDDGKDRYEYPEFLDKQCKQTKKLYEDITKTKDPSLDFLRESNHYYLDTTEKTINQTFEWALSVLNEA